MSPPPGNPPLPASSRGTALVVDDSPANRGLLEALLQREGFATVCAENGLEAVERFSADNVDMVFMDVMMPVMDGIEACRRIKALAGERFVPVIFLTALKDDDSMWRCTEAGGDDFLGKPFSFAALNSRVRAMERIRDLNRRLVEQHRMLTCAHERDLLEQQLAERIFNRVVAARNVATDRIGVLQRPATLFCGDLVLTAHLPDGGLRVLVGDFTGHGLGAAIGALPVTEIFHSMSWDGARDTDLLAEINRRLFELLPADRFMAACMATLPARDGELRFWNGGMPCALLSGPRGRRVLSSRSLPLGILPELPGDGALERVPVQGDERLLMVSDGLLEAEGLDGTMFGEAALYSLMETAVGGPLLPELVRTLDAHCAGVEQRDDITVVEIPMDGVSGPRAHGKGAGMTDGWRWSMEWADRRLVGAPAVLEALRPLGLLDGLEAHAGALEVIVSELYANALEHGLMRLPSTMKVDSDGFDAYYTERARRLAEGVRGSIALELSYEPLDDGGQLVVRISDSGRGFDPGTLVPVEEALLRPWGRGIALVRELCESLEFFAGGSLAEAVYRWQGSRAV
ncbi:serine/threonine protein phosphatase [Thioalkalivibrio denitrificans]|uniref:Serine/threonine protein phosphatase n=1 Tax=Thioalkalivibrio denitrificans TaxID=108003 RepID=A0A1V3NGQ5_9GAMM|nr:serine/threonine protein phosphatase [Thioalkalivibrio denitrificans]